MTAHLLRAAVVFAMLAVVAPALPAHERAAAAQPGACPDADGVTVVVDFQELGGSTIIRCAAGPQSTGLAALKDAGISITGTTRWGEAFICRIEGRPGPDTESCIDTPPATAYWSYWHAVNGGSWTYSQRGATARTPPPGSFEGWSFALDRGDTGAPPPRVAPRRPDPPRAAPQQPETEPEQPSGAGPADGSGAPDTSEQDQPEADRPTAIPSAPPVPSPTPAVPSSVATIPSASPSPATPPEVDNAAPRSSSSAPVGTLLGLGLLLALVAVAAVTGWRRRASRD
jgi:hypothetical protein